MKRVAVDSEALRALGYDPQRRELEVEFHDQRVYRYREVPPEAVLALLQAESLGRHFTQVFKPAGYPYRRLDAGTAPEAELTTGFSGQKEAGRNRNERSLIADQRRVPMSDHHTYKKVEIVGSSRNSVDEAIQNGIAEASGSLKNVEWFEVDEIRGHVVDGKVGHFQVTMKVGFRLENS